MVRGACSRAPAGAHMCAPGPGRMRPGPSCLRRRGCGDLLRVALALSADQRTVVRARLGTSSPAGEREAEDRALDHPQLLVERSAVVGKAVADADLANLRRDLPVPRAWHIRVQVMLDLISEVPAQHVEH